MKSISRIVAGISLRAKVTYGLCGAFAVANTAFFAEATALLQFVALGLLGACFICSVQSLAEWKKLRFWAVLPSLLSLLALIISAWTGVTLKIAIFERRLPRYRAFVQQIEAGTIPVSTNAHPISLPKADRDLAYFVWAQRDTNGVLIVEFSTDSGWPAKHSGYLYCSAGSVPPGSSSDVRWRGKFQIHPKWFRIYN